VERGGGGGIVICLAFKNCCKENVAAGVDLELLDFDFDVVPTSPSENEKCDCGPCRQGQNIDFCHPRGLVWLGLA
jgi:hypothetical protein